MSIKIMSWVWENSPCKGSALLIHLAFADFADDEGTCWPSQARLADKARCTVENVRLTTRQLEEQGLIELVEKSNGRGSHKYRVNTPVSQPPKIFGPPKSQGGDSPNLKGVTPQNSFLRTINEPSKEPPSFSVIASLDHFEEFWDVYPRKVGKKAATTAFVKACRKASAQAIIDGARRFAADPNREEQFTPHPTTWLNQGRWEDDPLPTRAVKSSGTRTYLQAANSLSESHWELEAADDPF